MICLLKLISISTTLVEQQQKPSTPLIAKGGKAAVLEAPETVNGVEGETSIITVLVEGNPAPKIKWYYGVREILSEGRYLTKTDGSDNSSTLLIKKTKHSDEVSYLLFF